MTFGPDGITGHTDHCVVSAWVTEAWRRTRGAELLYATMTDAHVARWAELHARIGLFADRGPAGPASGAGRAGRARRRADRAPSSTASGERSRATRARPSPSPPSWARPPTGPGCATEYFRRPTAEEIRSCAITFASHDPASDDMSTVGATAQRHPGMAPRPPGVSRHRPDDHRRRADRDRHRRHDQHVAGPRARRMGGRAVDRRRCGAAPHHPDAGHRERAVRDRRVGRARQRPGDRATPPRSRPGSARRRCGNACSSRSP